MILIFRFARNYELMLRKSDILVYFSFLIPPLEIEKLSRYYQPTEFLFVNLYYLEIHIKIPYVKYSAKHF